MDTLKSNQSRNKMEKKSTKEARVKDGDSGREKKKEYLALKRFALGRERENFSKLFVFQDNKGWWKMVGHSAVIFYYDIADRIGMKTKLKEDTDFDLKSEDGVVNIKSITLLTEKLETVKIQLFKLEDKYRIYNIGKKYDVSELERMKKAKELEWDKVNKIILPRQIYPTLYKYERELLVNSYFSMKRMETFARENFTSEMMAKMAEMVRDYSLVMNEGTEAEVENYLIRCENNLKWMRAQMAIFAELKLFELDVILRISYAIEKILKEVSSCRVRKI